MQNLMSKYNIVEHVVQQLHLSGYMNSVAPKQQNSFAVMAQVNAMQKIEEELATKELAGTLTPEEALDFHVESFMRIVAMIALSGEDAFTMIEESAKKAKII